MYLYFYSTLKSTDVTAKDTEWTDSFTYVEVNAAGFSDSEQQPDVLKVEHQSPRSVDRDSIPVMVVHEAESPPGGGSPIGQEGDQHDVAMESPLPGSVYTTSVTPVQPQRDGSVHDQAPELVAHSDGPSGSRAGLCEASGSSNDEAAGAGPAPSTGSQRSVEDRPADSPYDAPVL